MDHNMYEYDAFISYRHSELDKFVAETLQKEMENFKPPRNIIKNSRKKKINRVFRDQDELPLTSNLEDPIINALMRSEYLIVICSPRLRESLWCKKEIQTFISMHGRHRVFAVLVEGEPSESFPEELLYEDVTQLDANGNYVTVRRPIEPLAADLRGADEKEIKKKMKLEMLRLLAPMFGVNFDDLRQRHREQKHRKMLAAAAVVAAIGMGFGTISTISAMMIRKQKSQIEHQAKQLETQNNQLQEQKEQLQEQKELLARDQAKSLANEAKQLLENDCRLEAISLAKEALTVHDGIEMPETPEAMRILTEAMATYDGANYPRAAMQYDMDGVVEGIKQSPDGRMVICIDDIGDLVVFDMVENKKLYHTQEDIEIESFGFVDDDRIYYVSYLGALCIHNLKTGEDLFYGNMEQEDAEQDEISVTSESINEAFITEDGKYFAVTTISGIQFIDSNSLKQVASWSEEGYELYGDLYFSKDSKTLYVQLGNFMDDSYVALDISNINSGVVEEKFRFDGIGDMLSDMVVTSDRIYLFSVTVEVNFGFATVVKSVDANTGETLFKTSVPNIAADHFFYAESDTHKNLLVTDWDAGVLLNANTGELIRNYTLHHPATMCLPMNDASFTILLSDGTAMHVLDDENHTLIEIPGIMCHDIEYMIKTDAGYVGYRSNDHHLIKYALIVNADVKEYDGKLLEPVAEALERRDAKEYCEEHNIKRASFVDECIEVKDLNLLYVLYRDGIVDVYSLEDYSLIREEHEMSPYTYSYLGKVGPYYVLMNIVNMYLLNENGEICMDIPNASGIAADKSGVVMSGRNVDLDEAQIIIPFYETDQLVEKADAILDALTLEEE